MNKDKYFEDLTNKVVALMKEEKLEWKKPWKSSARTGPHYNAKSGHVFTGNNPMWLMLDSWIKGFTDNRWATFNQWRALGSRVERGQTATPLLKPLFGKKDDEGKSPLIGWTTLMYFNYEQVTHPEDEELAPPPEFEHTLAEDVLTQCNPKLKHGGGRACYIPSIDTIKMPHISDFLSENDYWSTMFHELTHWTSHKDRLDRQKPSYAFEELVAELGSVFVCAQTGVSPQPRTDHIAYLQEWIKHMQEDHAFVFMASKQAQAAASYILKPDGSGPSNS